MKQVLLALSLLISCTTFAFWDKVEGNGKIKEDKRTVAGFSNISYGGSYSLNIVYGNTYSVTITTDENLTQYFITEVSKNTLSVQMKNGVEIKPTNRLTITITTDKLNELRFSGSGNITAVGKFENDGEVNIKMSGSGNTTFGFLAPKKVNIALSGSGNITAKSVNKETTDEVNIAISGSGNVTTDEVLSNTTTVKLSGSGNARVYASNTLTNYISGSGGVQYKGNATNITNKVSGKNKVTKID